MKRFLKSTTLCLAMLGAFSQAVNAQAPPSGPCLPNLVDGNWTFVGNGSHATMTLFTNTSGNLVAGSRIKFPNGTTEEIGGFWTASACKLTFFRAILGTATSMNPSNSQIFTGFVFPYISTAQTGTKMLAGSFEAFAGTGGTAVRNVFGWYAIKH